MRLTAILLLILVIGVGRGLTAQDSNFVLTMTHAVGLQGQVVEVNSILNDPTGRDLRGWSLGVCQEGDAVEIEDVTTGGATTSVNDGAGPEFLYVSPSPGQGWSAVVVLDFTGSACLPPGLDHELHTAMYRCVHPGEVRLSYCDDHGTTAVPTKLYDEVGRTIRPVTHGGSVQVATGPPPTPFLRGDADGNGSFQGLVDGIYVLGFLFVLDHPAPPCLAAADADGNHAFDGLPDALYALTFQYVPGSPPIPPPYPDCGESADTTDNLGCITTPCP